VVGVLADIAPRDPRDYVTAPYNGTDTDGYTLVNVLQGFAQVDSMGCGEPAMACGTPYAECGENTKTPTGSRRVYPVPDEDDAWVHVLYVCGETLGAVVELDEGRRAELEALLIRYTPAQAWVVLRVDYIGGQLSVYQDSEDAAEAWQDGDTGRMVME
jgi:hypothetical protein